MKTIITVTLFSANGGGAGWERELEGGETETFSNIQLIITSGILNKMRAISRRWITFLHLSGFFLLLLLTLIYVTSGVDVTDSSVCGDKFSRFKMQAESDLRLKVVSRFSQAGTCDSFRKYLKHVRLVLFMSESSLSADASQKPRA